MKYSLFFLKITTALFLILFVKSIRIHADEEGEVSENQKVEVNLSEVSARVSPSLEFVVPSGNVYEHFVQYFNHIKMSFELNYNFFQNSISGDVTFSYPYRRINPETRFFVNLDFENYFYPEF